MSGFFDLCNRAYFDQYTVALQKEGIEVIYYPFVNSIESFLLEKGNFYDFIVLSRITVAREFLHLIKNKLKRPKIIFNTVDLHFLRQEREALLKKDLSLLEQAKRTQQEEIEAIRLSDLTLLVSEVEKKLVSELVPSAKTVLMPIPRSIPGRRNRFEQREGILFIGGFQHQPNLDAVEYFLDRIWPIIRNNIGEVTFIIAGSNMPQQFADLNGKDGIKAVGYVRDLADLFEKVKISVAPLRYGAGVKGKILTSLSFGVPCVATTLAIEGMGLVDGENILVADSPHEFAERVVMLYTSAHLWESLSKNGLRFVQEKYSIESARKVWLEIISELRKSS